MNNENKSRTVDEVKEIIRRYIDDAETASENIFKTGAQNPDSHYGKIEYYIGLASAYRFCLKLLDDINQ